MNFNSSRVRTNFYRENMPHLLRFMAKNDVKRFDWFKSYGVFFYFQAITLDMSLNQKC